MQVYRSSDFRTWSTSNDTLFQPAECPSLFKIPRKIYTNGKHNAGYNDNRDVPTHVYKGSGIHCLVNGQHAKVSRELLRLPLYSLVPICLQLPVMSQFAVPSVASDHKARIIPEDDDTPSDATVPT